MLSLELVASCNPLTLSSVLLEKTPIAYMEIELLLIVNFRRRPSLSRVYQFVHQKERPGAHFQSVDLELCSGV